MISKTGQRQEISKGEMNVMVADWNASAKRYTGGKILVANLPGVDVGSTIEVEYEVASHGKAYISGRESFQLPDKIDQKLFRLTAPPSIMVLKMVSGSPSFIHEESRRDNGRQTFQWQTKQSQALPAERELPPEWIYSAGVNDLIGDPNSYLTTLNNTLLDRSRQCSKAEALVHRLTAKCKTKLETVKVIRDYAPNPPVAGLFLPTCLWANFPQPTQH